MNESKFNAIERRYQHGEPMCENGWLGDTSIGAYDTFAEAQAKVDSVTGGMVGQIEVTYHVQTPRGG